MKHFNYNSLLAKNKTDNLVFEKVIFIKFTYSISNMNYSINKINYFKQKKYI